MAPGIAIEGQQLTFAICNLSLIFVKMIYSLHSLGLGLSEMIINIDNDQSYAFRHTLTSNFRYCHHYG